MKEIKNSKGIEKGITLIALVVTIVVLIILATISINAVLGENGIIKKAEQAKEVYSNSIISEEEEMNLLLAEYENAMAERTEGGNSMGGTDTPTETDNRPLITTITTTDHETITAKDEKGNQVVVPGGFKVRADLGDTVQDGIVIEDSDGNQFVWIPVSNTNGDGSNKIILDDGSSVEITLGRYTFDSSTGAETIQQYGANYTDTVTIETYYQELSTFRESSSASKDSLDMTDMAGKNATAQDLEGFINSVSTNKGYYLARYEASYALGSTFGVGNDSSYYKPTSKISSSTRTSASSTLTSGMLWNYITQGNASKASRQMYYGNSYVESDLVNSYAWDTAIVYIQKMGNSNYANADRGSNTSLLNTGETGDGKCNIYDMAGNCFEWTTEYSIRSEMGVDYFPCTWRGGGFSSTSSSKSRSGTFETVTYDYTSFRVLLYGVLNN